MENTVIINVAIIVWLVLLTGLLAWVLIFFKKLSKGVKKGNLIKILEDVVSRQQKLENLQISLGKSQEIINEKMLSHIQKVGVVRFNPFDDMGGDHSFSIALLDGQNTGIVLTGLHTRERTRVYIKEVKNGKTNYGLSKEEEKALSKALKSS